MTRTWWISGRPSEEWIVKVGVRRSHWVKDSKVPSAMQHEKRIWQERYCYIVVFVYCFCEMLLCPKTYSWIYVQAGDLFFANPSGRKRKDIRKVVLSCPKYCSLLLWSSISRNWVIISSEANLILLKILS